MVGKAFRFDGFDDYIFVPYNPIFYFGEQQDLTLDAWINLQNPVPGFDDEIVDTGGEPRPGGLFRFFVARDTRKLRLQIHPGTANYVVESQAFMQLNQRTHVAAIRKGAMAFLYINGALDASTTLTDGSLANPGPLSIGGIYDTRFNPPVQPNNVFGGLIDELELHRRALSAQEIHAIYQAGSFGKCKEPQGWPEGMAFDPTTGLITWTPALVQAGKYFTTVEVTDGRGGKDVQTFVLEVPVPPNQPPVITSTPATSAQGGVPYQYDVEAGDLDGDPLTYRIVVGDFAGLQDIAVDASGTIFVVDDRASGGLGGVFQVEPLSGTQTVLASGGSLVGPNAIAIDANGDLIVVDPFAFNSTGGVIRIHRQTGIQTTITSGGNFAFPTDLAIADNGVMYVTDTHAFGGSGGVIQVDPQTGMQTIVSSGGSFVHPIGIAITANGDVIVLDRNAFSTGPQDGGGGVIRVHPDTGAQTTILSGNFGNTFTRVEMDANQDILVSAFSLLHEGLLFRVDPQSRTRSIVASGGDLRLPVGLARDNSGNVLVADLRASGTGGVLRVVPTTGSQTIVSPRLIQGMSIDGPTGLISWTPSIQQTGLHEVTVEVSDGGGGTDTQSFPITVLGQNRAPAITSSPHVTATVGQPYSYDVDAADLDAGDMLTFSLTTAPAGMMIDTMTGLIQWTATAAQMGSHPVAVRVQDAGGLSDTQNFTITVASAPPANQPPVITSTPSTTATVGQLYTYDVHATDPNAGDTLTFSLLTAPAGMTIHATTGVIQWTPTTGQVGTNAVKVRVQDQEALSATQEFTITVAAGGMVAVPDVIGQTPSEAETLLTAATLTAGTITTVDNTIPLGVTTLPSVQGWVYGALDNTAPESRAFAITNDVLQQNTFGLSTTTDPDALGGNLYQLSEVVDARLPFTLALTARVLEEEGDTFDPFSFSVGVVTETEQFAIGINTQRVRDAFGEEFLLSIDPTQFHDYRLEGTPGVGFRLFTDNIFVGTGQPFPRSAAGSSFLSLGDASALSVVGLPQAQAMSTLVAAQLSVGAIQTAFSLTVPVGQVSSQTPAAGAMVPERTAVALAVALGPPQVTVPDVVGQPQAEAEAMLLAAQLTVGAVTTQYSATIPAGQVISQAPAAGTTATAGVAVNLVVSLGPPSQVAAPEPDRSPGPAATRLLPPLIAPVWRQAWRLAR